MSRAPKAHLHACHVIIFWFIMTHSFWRYCHFTSITLRPDSHNVFYYHEWNPGVFCCCCSWFFFFYLHLACKICSCLQHFTFIFQVPIVCNKDMIISTKTNFNHKCKRIYQYSHFIKFLETQKIYLQHSVPFNDLNSAGEDEYLLVFVSSDLLQASLLSSNSVCCTHL